MSDVPSKDLPAVLPDQLVSDLANRRYFVWPHAVSPSLIDRLRQSFAAKRSDFRPAQIGRSGESRIEAAIRNDSLLWLDEGDLTPAEAEFFALLESLRLKLNRELFLGLTGFEAHYALYPSGHFYARHIDRFKSDSRRIISVVVYLNTNWGDADGGFLRLYVERTLEPNVATRSETTVEVRPEGGTLTAFLSDEIEHEVLLTNRDRMSIAVWFRRTEKF